MNLTFYTNQTKNNYTNKFHENVVSRINNDYSHYEWYRIHMRIKAIGGYTRVRRVRSNGRKYGFLKAGALSHFLAQP